MDGMGRMVVGILLEVQNSLSYEESQKLVLVLRLGGSLQPVLGFPVYPDKQTQLGE